MRKYWRQFVLFMSLPADNPELLRAQYQALSRQLPMMYLILMSSTWALAATHFRIAPFWLTVFLPCMLTAGSILRVTHWWRSRSHTPSAGEVLTALRRTNKLAYLIATAFTVWSFALFPYGDAYTRSHVAFYMSITVISCIFCLMHVRSAAFVVTAIVNISFILFFLGTTQPTFVAIAVNITLVNIGMLSILLVNYRNFAQMVESQVKTEALSNENLRLANMDSLTDLPNRRAFFTHLKNTFETAQEKQTKLAIGIVDLDGFKPVNDIYGHSTGDRLLVQVGQRLTGIHAGAATQFFRLGGDEFAFISTDRTDDESALALGNQIGTLLRKPFNVTGVPVQISASVGVAIYPDTAQTHEALYEYADYAQYHSKNTQRGSVTIFSNALDAQIHREAMVEQVLRQANLDDELSVMFQPIIDMKSGQPICMEALARWNSPVLGFVSPAEFIPIAERSGLIHSITRVALKKALAAAQAWPRNTRLSFNLSAQDLNAQESALSVAAILTNSKVDVRRIDFEITETAFAHDFDQIRESVESLRSLGCGIALDDFGTGYSSLTRLHALPLTKIKIDRSFVTGIDRKSASIKIVKSLLALSRDMNLGCIVEGVETTEELETLRRLGARYIQGYIYSKPLGESEIAEFVGSRQANADRTAKSTATS